MEKSILLTMIGVICLLTVRHFSDTKFTLIANICSSNPIDFHHWFSTQSRARIV